MHGEIIILCVIILAVFILIIRTSVKKQRGILEDFSQTLDRIGNISELAEANQKKTRELLIASLSKAKLGDDDEFAQQVSKTLNELEESKDKIVAECQSLALKISEDLKKNPALNNLKIEVTRK